VYGGLVISRQWRPTWETLRAHGAKRANVWLPIAFTIGAAIVLVVALSIKTVLREPDAVFDLAP
jgi:hypothetical protein